ncbi:ROK family protein [Kineococcus sp. SYSU DK018]|uniref:ROK family protein n=1 Tax=Kineococcus sp. SYSU DK018 TaxID=3383139 RepID=UPI003D7E90CB
MGTLTARGEELLRLAHERPDLTRAEAARTLGTGTGTTADLVARLTSAHLIDERPAAPGGGRGRPTRHLVPHRAGPLVLGAVVSHEDWAVGAVALGGAPVATERGTHDGGDGTAVLRAVRAAAVRLRRGAPGRVRGLGVAVPGLVHDGHLLDAPILGWRGLDLRAALAAEGEVFLAGNDATLAAVGEARRGAAAGAAVHLHLHVDAGLGGAVTTGGHPLEGAHGLAGEFGHVPFGDPAVRCPCGAHGCWGTTLDGTAFARALGEPPPGDPVSYARRALERAAAGDEDALHAARAVGTSLGRGAGGLVNALDADLVTLGGLAARLLAVVPDEVRGACEDGLMRSRRSAPPALVPAALGDDGPLTGAAELVWSQLWGRL